MMKRKITVCLVLLSMICTAVSCSTESAEGNSTAETPVETTEATETEAPVTTEPVEPDYVRPEPDENAITFDDGDDIYTARCANDANFENDESECRLSVAEFKGDKQLKIEILDFDEAKKKYKTPKIAFDVDALVGSENLSKVKSFSCDITHVAAGEFIGDDGEPMMVPGNLMGTFGSVLGEDCDEWYVPTGSSNEYASAEWTFGWDYIHVEGKWLLKGFVDGTTGSTLIFMRWSIPNQADVYLDNLTFYDEEGNSIPIIYKPGEISGDSGEEQNSETESGGENAAGSEETASEDVTEEADAESSEE